MDKKDIPQAGELISLRDRDWVVQPSDNEDLLIIKPLGGSEAETTGIYLPLEIDKEKPKAAHFKDPSTDDLGDISTSRILYNAARLSFRNGAGPFRSLAKLSFRPRAYQIVPLVMALKQDPVRLLIADDVGVGKTIEALLVMREMLERRQIKRFAVICLPHLCEQWQEEIRTKLDIEAVIIRTNTQAQLDRQIQGDTSIYDNYPYQIISIDFIKSDKRRDVFVQQAPELVVVDEAHTCSRPSGASRSKQQRHLLLSKIAEKEGQHLIMLTATPHSGKPEEFQSLLGLLHPEFENWDLPSASSNDRKKLAKHFVQRLRADVRKWMDEDTPFPERYSFEQHYDLTPKYKAFFEDILTFTRKLVSTESKGEAVKRAHYWVALALLRGVMSSPDAGVKMLQTRMANLMKASADDEDTAISGPLEEEMHESDADNPVGDDDFGFNADSAPIHLVENNDWSQYQRRQLRQFADRLQGFSNPTDDDKLNQASIVIKEWLKEGYNPVVFCRYIATAKYLGKHLGEMLQEVYPKMVLNVITSEEPDEIRKQNILAMEKRSPRVLIATECLSEGINLQNLFTAVMHYDLPWNPNRLEQREGRVDRFGQTAPTVKTCFLYGADNPIDAVVLDVLLRKVREIKKATGINVPFPENSQSIIDTITKALLLNPDRQIQKTRGSKDQQALFDKSAFPEAEAEKDRVTRKIDEAAEREKASRSVFAQNRIKPNAIEKDLKEADEAIGRSEDVRDFVRETLENIIGIEVQETDKGLIFVTGNLPDPLKGILPEGDTVKVSFTSPTPEGYYYLGRNHLFVEQLCQLILVNTMEKADKGAARASVIRTRDVTTKTTILLFRCRNVIEQASKTNRIVAEEMLLWGWEGALEDEQYLDHNTAKDLLTRVRPSSDISPQARKNFLENELSFIDEVKRLSVTVAEEQNKKLVDAHQRFSSLVSTRKFQVVYPVLPMDILGIYVLLPEVAQ